MKICVATGTRAEYGLLKPLINSIILEPNFELQLLVTGAHLSPEFGLTYRQIEEDGLKIDSKVEMLLSSDTAEGITKSMGLGMIGYATSLNELKPDLIVILGDRYEMLSIASSALIFKIPIVHLHGGEITEGAYDDAIRHAITKMSHLHFTSTEQYRNRVIQLGEHPDHVFNVGAIGLDNISALELVDKVRLAKDLNIKFKKYNYLVAFHPETLSIKSVEEQIAAVLNAFRKQKDSLFIFTKANADSEGRIINEMIRDFCQENSSGVLFSSLGSVKFLSLMKFVDAVVGNSSSGIIEAPSMGVATINIGDRQKGRIQANNVINCEAIEASILEAFEKIRDLEFRKSLEMLENPYGSGETTEKIMSVLRSINPSSLKLKTFYNV